LTVVWGRCYNGGMATVQSDQHRNPNIDELLPSDLLHEDEVVVFAVKPSLWSVAFLSFRTVVVAVAVAASVILFGPSWRLGGLNTYIVEGCGAAIVARIGFALLQWLSRSYVLTDKRVIRIRGVFTIDIFQCGLPKIQNTFLIMTVPQRLLNLGNIAFATAGTSQIEAIWRHVKDPLKIHQQLLRAINAASNKPALQEAKNGL
jgi:hypothetical protein